MGLALLLSRRDQTADLSSLTPPTKLTVLNQDNYLPILAHPRTVDLGLVERITQDRHLFPWLGKAFRAEPQFLQKCRRLKSIRMISLGKKSFDWAVREKRLVDDAGCVAIERTDSPHDNDELINNNEHVQVVLSLRTESSQVQQQERGRLVPLESMYLYRTTYDREIDDIAFAFSRTLRSLTVGTFLTLTNIPLMEPISTPEGPIFPICHIGHESICA